MEIAKQSTFYDRIQLSLSYPPMQLDIVTGAGHLFKAIPSHLFQAIDIPTKIANN